MKSRAALILVLVLVVYYVATAPAEAASIVRSLQDLLTRVGAGLDQFGRSLS